MEQSEKEELKREIQAMIHNEVGPVLDILMDYLDVRFDEVDERFMFLFHGVNELVERLIKVLDVHDPAN